MRTPLGNAKGVKASFVDSGGSQEPEDPERHAARQLSGADACDLSPIL
jgi:hypothetical protein